MFNTLKVMFGSGTGSFVKFNSFREIQTHLRFYLFPNASKSYFYLPSFAVVQNEKRHHSTLVEEYTLLKTREKFFFL